MPKQCHVATTYSAIANLRGSVCQAYEQKKSRVYKNTSMKLCRLHAYTCTHPCASSMPPAMICCPKIGFDLNSR